MTRAASHNALMLPRTRAAESGEDEGCTAGPCGHGVTEGPPNGFSWGRDTGPGMGASLFLTLTFGIVCYTDEAGGRVAFTGWHLS